MSWGWDRGIAEGMAAGWGEGGRRGAEGAVGDIVARFVCFRSMSCVRRVVLLFFLRRVDRASRPDVVSACKF